MEFLAAFTVTLQIVYLFAVAGTGKWLPDHHPRTKEQSHAEAMEARFGADQRMVDEYNQHKAEVEQREHERRVKYMQDNH
jgi:hypothetical protein